MPPPKTVPCHACSGRFSFEFDKASERFVCRHSLPYCQPFRAITSTLDALRFAERCDLSIQPDSIPVTWEDIEKEP